MANKFSDRSYRQTNQTTDRLTDGQTGSKASFTSINYERSKNNHVLTQSHRARIMPYMRHSLVMQPFLFFPHCTANITFNTRKFTLSEIISYLTSLIGHIFATSNRVFLFSTLCTSFCDLENAPLSLLAQIYMQRVGLVVRVQNKGFQTRF